MSTESIKFKAIWNENNSHLQDGYLTLEEKVTCAALAVITYLSPIFGIFLSAAYFAASHFVHEMARRKILPSSQPVTPEEQEKRKLAKQTFHDYWHGPVKDAKHQKIRDCFEPVYQTVATPDDVELDAVWIRHKQATEETPTLLYCNGNFQIYHQFPFWPFEKAVEANTPCHFVLFNYRGVDTSKGKIKSGKHLILDVDSIVQWILGTIKTRPENLHFYGLSLGGATSLEAHALNPSLLTGKHVHHNSFSSSHRMMEVIFGEGIAKHIASYLFDWKGYSSHPEQAFAKLKGQTLILVNPEDKVIPFRANLQSAVAHTDTVILEPKKEFEEDSEKIWRHHAAPLEWHDNAIDRVWEFLFGKGSSQTEAS